MVPKRAQTMNKIDATLVSEFFRKLTEKQPSPSADAVLQGLTQLFRADEVGVDACPSELFPTAASLRQPFPWHRDGDLLDRIGTSLCAESFQEDDGNWLVCQIGETHLVWAFRSSKRDWTESDKWAWLIASQILLRWRMQSVRTESPLQRRLEQAAIVTGRLSHDFGNYLTGIMGFTELSLGQVPADGLMHRYLQEVLQAAKDAAEWIRRLHLFCRRNPTRSWPTVLACLLAEEEARWRAEGLNLRWITDVPEDLPLLDIDAEALQIVLTELVNNTREAVEDQGTIRFTARTRGVSEADTCDVLGSVQAGTYVEFTVADDGPGIGPDEHAKLFRDMFYSTKPRHRGLGLLVVYGIMIRSLGGLRLLKGEGSGTTVQLLLPIAALEKSTPREAESANLLVVHANPLLSASMRVIFESRGWNVSVADSADAALSAYFEEEQSFALVVADALLPQMSGFDLARRILDHDAEANFLFLHTESSFHGLAQEDLLQSFALLRWPLEPNALLKAAQTALAKD
jgi:signal transduction histidine kinase/CheY-like chemotaxis protein